MDLRRKVFLNEEGDARSLVGGTVALAARFSAHARLRDQVKNLAVQEDLDLSCDFCCRYQTETFPREHYQLFSASWKEGVAQAEQV